MSAKKPLCLYNDAIKQIQSGDALDVEIAGMSLVKADSTDSTAGYLSAKVDGVTIEVNTSTHTMNVKSDVYDAYGATSTHSALQTGIHGISITAGKVLSSLKTITITSADDTSVITFPSGTKTLVATDGNITGSSGSCTGNASTVTTNANLTGEVISTGNATAITNSAVLGKVITGFTSTPGLVLATDTILGAIQKLNGNTAASGSGTVTSVSVVTANGVSASVATETITPAITIILDAITPSTVNALTLAKATTGFTIAGGDTSKTLTVSDTASISGTNTGDNATNTQYSSLVTNATHTSDATGSGALTVVAINGTNLAGLATGALMNATTTGVPTVIEPSTLGNILTSTGTAWASSAPALKRVLLASLFAVDVSPVAYMEVTDFTVALLASTLYHFKYKCIIKSNADYGETVKILCSSTPTRGFMSADVLADNGATLVHDITTYSSGLIIATSFGWTIPHEVIFEGDIMTNGACNLTFNIKSENATYPVEIYAGSYLELIKGT